jgi:glutamine synthetase
VDSSCNPYLAAAAMLAAGLDGIEKKTDPGKVNERDMYELSAAELRRTRIPMLPTNLKEAIDSLRKDDVIRKAVGIEYADYYCDQKLDEWRVYHNTVSPWEIDRYLTMF